MSFQQAISGLNAASKNLEIIGNNVANSSTIGFKSSAAQFADVYAASVAGASLTDAGIGVSVGSISTDYSQGGLSVTNNPLDVAINGSGFFQLQREGQTVFSRDGQFRVDASGYMANSAGDRLEGYGVDANATVQASSSAQPIAISSSDISPKPSSSLGVTANLDSTRPALDPTQFDATVPSTFTSTTTAQLYDSLGNAHTLSLFFIHSTAAANTWDVRAQLDGGNINAGGSVSDLVFLPSGAIDTTRTTLPIQLSLTMGGGAASPQALSLGFNGTTQFGAAFGVTAISQDGYASGKLLGLNIGADGLIQGRYSNGQSRPQGQIALASFTDVQGLQFLGNNAWAATKNSGQPVTGAPGTGTMGSLQSGALEQSNVDLTASLVAMITAQRTYQANAETIKTQDALLQTMVSLR